MSFTLSEEKCPRVVSGTVERVALSCVLGPAVTGEPHKGGPRTGICSLRRAAALMKVTIGWAFPHQGNRVLERTRLGG